MDLSKLSRREFIRTAAVGTAGLTLTQLPMARFALGDKREPEDKPLYRFVMLGDMHYDRVEHHDMKWVSDAHPGDVNQIKNYVLNSEKYTPALLNRVKKVVAGSDLPLPFVLQLGDLTEGLCGSYELASKQMSDVTGLIDQTALGTRFLMCKGNHDITGPGAPEAYDNVLLPWLGKQFGQKLTTAHYSVAYKGDLFVFFDAYKPNLDWLQKEFDRYPKVRHTFFVLHPPVVPYNARADWIVYAGETARPMRQRLIEMLARRNAIVLSGHLHKYGLLEYRTQKGSFTQVAVSSVLTKDHPKPKDERIGVPAYSKDLVDLEPNFNPATREKRIQLLNSEQPFIQRYEYADLPGYAVVDVHETGISCSVFGGVDETPYRTESLITSAKA